MKEGLQVALVTCGPWHTPFLTSTAQFFTFDDGTHASPVIRSIGIQFQFGCCYCSVKYNYLILK